MISKVGVKRHSKSAYDESEAIRILSSVLEKTHQIKTFFKENDRTPNQDGFFEITKDNGEPIKKFDVQIKKVENLSRTKDGYIYQLDTSFLDYVKNRVTDSPAVYFVVDISTHRIFYLYLSSSLLDKLSFEGKGKITYIFSDEDILKDTADFYLQMLKVAEGKQEEKCDELIAIDYAYLRAELQEKMKKECYEHSFHAKREISETIIPNVSLKCDEDTVSFTYYELLKYVKEKDIRLMQIIGEGGKGKTTFLLKMGMTLNSSDDSLGFFIRLHEVNELNEDDANVFIQNKIYEQAGNIGFDVASIECVLMLDGFNEVKSDYQGVVARQIREIQNSSNIRIILTSRQKMTGKVGLYGISSVVIEDLQQNQIESYLTSKSIELKKTELFKGILKSPMVLTVFANTNQELIYNNDVEYFKFYETCGNKTELILNFMESVAAKQFMQNIGDENMKHQQLCFLLYITHFMIPYIAYRMERENQFVIGETLLFEYVEQLIYNERNNRFIQRWFSQRGIISIEWFEKLEIVGVVEALKSFSTVLFYEQRKWKFTHQDFREVLAAKYIVMECEKVCIQSQNEIPVVLKSVLSQEIQEYIGELIMGDKEKCVVCSCDILHEVVNRLRNQSADVVQIPLHNILQVWKLAKINLAGEDFSGLDLKGQILAPYVQQDGRKITDFTNAIIYSETLLPVGHEGTVGKICYSPDGVLIASAGEDQTVCLWDSETGQLVRKMDMYWTSFVSGLSFSFNMQYLAASTFEEIVVWNLEDETECYRIHGHGDIISGICWHPYRNELIFGQHDGRVFVWNLKTQDLILCLEVGMSGDAELDYLEKVLTVCVSPNGKNIAVGYESGSIRVWNSVNGVLSWEMKAHESGVRDIKFSSDSQCLYTAGNDCTVAVWNVSDRSLLKRLTGHKKFIFELSLNEDKNLLATASADQTAKVWDIISGECVHTLEGHREYIQRVRFQPHGDYLVTADCDGIVGIWNSDTGENIHMIKCHQDIISSIAFSPDGEFLATGSLDETMFVWNVRTGKMIHSMMNNGSRIQEASFTTEQKLLTVDYPENTARVWDVSARKCLWKKEKVSWPFVFAPKGKWAADYVEDKIVELWDIEHNVCLWKREHNNNVKKILFTSDGSHVLIGVEDYGVEVVEIESGRNIVVLEGKVHDFLFSPNEKHLVVTSKEKLVIWNCDWWEIEEEYRLSSEVYPHALFTPDSRFLAVSYWHKCFFIDLFSDRVTESEISMEDKMLYRQDVFGETYTESSEIKIWNYLTGTVKNVLKYDYGRVECIVHNIKYGLTAALFETGDIILWNISDGKQVEHFPETIKGAWKLCFSEDNEKLLCIKGTIVYCLDWRNGEKRILIDQRYHEALIGCKLTGAKFDSSMKQEDIELLLSY